MLHQDCHRDFRPSFSVERMAGLTIGVAGCTLFILLNYRIHSLICSLGKTVVFGLIEGIPLHLRNNQIITRTQTIKLSQEHKE